MLVLVMKKNKHIQERQLLSWHLGVGVDETITNVTVERLHLLKNKNNNSAFKLSMEQHNVSNTDVFSIDSTILAQNQTLRATSSKSRPSIIPQASKALSENIADNSDISMARHLAQKAETLQDLRQVLEIFDGCTLKKTATNLVFMDGNPEAEIMFIGEGPGAEEDRQGRPFVGASGKLLDKMLFSVGLDREKVLISNVVFWRPPGNRTPTSQELAICLPFVERMVQLVNPKILVALGGVATKILFAQGKSIGRIRGKWFPYTNLGLSSPIEATAMFHPAYLLRSPAQKCDTWKDWQVIKTKLEEF